MSFKKIIRTILTQVYDVDVRDLENYEQNGENYIIVANHTSFLDAALIYAFIPYNLTFAINTQVAKTWYVRILKRFVTMFPMDPGNPLSLRGLIKRVEAGETVVIFPEGRITVTGALMKIYQGPGLIALKSSAKVLPINIYGAQYTTFSRLRGLVRLRWFPKITLTVLPATKLAVNENYRGRKRRETAGKVLSDLMTDMMFKTSHYQTSLFDKLLDARKVYGGNHVIVEDIQRKPLNYTQVITKSLVLGKALTKHSHRDEYIGVLLPGALSTVVTFWALHAYGRVPAMLNYTAGPKGLVSACETAKLKTVVTAKAFIIKAKLGDVITALEQHVNVIYLEDIASTISLTTKLRGWVIAHFDIGLKARHRKQGVAPESPAVILFTSGSEGVPKAVVLSHTNILANINQLSARVDFSAQDTILNVLPLFHSFGLTAATLLPMIYGIKTFFYPSPLHYRIIPEVSYEIGATIMFGTNTFLAGYAKYAHPYDFYSIRYVFAGAEKLQEKVRQAWEEKFGVRIFEGYGATETSPVLTGNTPMGHKPGTVGRFFPGIKYHLEEVPGMKGGKRLQVKGPNVMLGYFLHDNPGVLVPPKTDLGNGWYDTGDIVAIDEEGFVKIAGRAKRFAKVGGEMVSLTAVESLANKVWPDAMNAAVAVPDEKKGEQIILLTTEESAERSLLVERCKKDGFSELSVPRRVMNIINLPVLGTGKVDYVSIQGLAEV